MNFLLKPVRTWALGLAVLLGSVGSAGVLAQAETDASNWHQWRGPENDGTSKNATPPLTWSESENLAWKVAIPGQGTACPIVWGDQVFVLTAVNTGKVDPSRPTPEDQPDRPFGIKYPTESFQMQVITTASKQVRAYNLETGEIIWSATGLTGNCIPCPIVVDDTVYCMSGHEGYSLLAIPITGTGDVTGSVRWKRDEGTPYVPSPVLVGDRLYFTKSNQNLLSVVDASDGRTVMEKVRLPDISGLYASPVAAANRIYFAGRNGKTLVVEPGDELKVLATNELDEHFHASPALAGSQMFLRGLKHLYCLESGAVPPKIAPRLGPAAKSADASADVPAKVAEEDPLIAELKAIAARPIPKDYPGGGTEHQPFVEREMDKLTPEQMGELGRLWREQRRLFPDMKNRGNSFIRILDAVRKSEPAKPPARAPKAAEPSKKQTSSVTGRISGRATDLHGRPLGGVMVSAFQDSRRELTSVFSQTDGRFELRGLPDVPARIRARSPGRVDQWIETNCLGADDVALRMPMATGEDLEAQRTADSAFAQLPFDSVRDKLNFKMMCSYCHQIGTQGFRTPEKPVDWETMIRRMDGFGGLYPHTRNTIVERIIGTYKDDAVKDWPPYEPPLPPSGLAAKARITSWEMGEPFVGSFHDLEIGDDGLAYVVHIGKQYTATLDPVTAERQTYRLPRGSHGPHSIEPDNEGHMWLTLCVSGEMAKFDLNTKKYMVMSSAEPPEKRGSWPHTLRVNPADPEGIVWYTDAGRNSVFSLHPKTLAVKEYHLLQAGQVKAGGKGESRGITPYGLDYSPVDGKIWYSKLNGNRIGRIDPKAPDGDITEWNPPFRGPRRLHVAPDGMVWVPGFGSGVFGRFDPNTETWTTYPLPNYENQIPYALNVAPDGMVWICGTGNDTICRFNPETEVLVEFPLPFRVSYTREIEFDADGNVWTSTSGPARHMENACGTIIRIELPKNYPEHAVGGTKLSPNTLSPDEQGILTEDKRAAQQKKLGELLVRIEARKLPKEYVGKPHQPYVDRVMKTIPPERRGDVNNLWQQRRRSGVAMESPGTSFVKILDYVANGEVVADGEVVAKPAMPAGVHRLKNAARSPFDAFVYVNRFPEKAHEGERPRNMAGRILGRLANQEGRVQIKLPPGMPRSAYDGFKTFLGAGASATASRCVECHRPNDFPAGKGSLRSAKHKPAALAAHLAELRKGERKPSATNADIPKLVAFLNSLQDVEESRFRELILEAKVTDVTVRAPAKPAKGLRGVVRYKGQPPPPGRLHMDEASRKLYEGKAPPTERSLLVGKGGGLANVFFEIRSEATEGEHPLPPDGAVLDQRLSVFEPRVQAIRVGQELIMKNSDPFIHNVRSLSLKNRAFNIAQPAGSPDRSKTFEAVEGPITIKCDFHRWMEAHFFIVDHPYYAVSDANGQFAIDGLPDGTHAFRAWHETLGEQEGSVTIRDGGGRIEFEFEEKE